MNFRMKTKGPFAGIQDFFFCFDWMFHCFAEYFAWFNILDVATKLNIALVFF